MKNKTTHPIFFRILNILFLVTLLAACTDDDSGVLSTPPAPIYMEGEGGETVVDVKYEDYKITQVLNTTGGGEMAILGKTYTPDGKLIKENTPLQLDGLGRIETLWNDRGFSIVRDKLSQLKVNVMENSRLEDFSFTIVLQAGNEIKKIEIFQKKSQGYTFDKIEYSIKPDDKDTFKNIDKAKYSFDIVQGFQTQIWPFKDLCFVEQQFESKDPNAFIWSDANKPKINIPKEITNNTILLNDQPVEYTSSMRQSPYQASDVVETILVPPGKSSYQVTREYRYRTVSYTITLINNRTKDKKKVEGKWIETSPTGKYSLKKIILTEP